MTEPKEKYHILWGFRATGTWEWLLRWKSLENVGDLTVST